MNGVKFNNQVTSADMIKFLEKLWQRDGIPEIIVMDNDVQFVSQTIKIFFKGVFLYFIPKVMALLRGGNVL